MANIMNKFEATMIACQKAKKNTSVLKENKKTSEKASKSMTENAKKTRKIQNKKVECACKRHRMVEEDEYDPEVDDVDLPADTATDAVVVVDPELDTDEYEANLDDLQAIIDDTPEGETPETDEYIDDYVYTCPICGNNFFSDTEMSNEACPVCGEEVDEFILVGEVEPAGEASADEEDMEDFDDEEIVDDEEDLEADLDDVADDEEDLEADIDDEDLDECLYKDAKCKDEGPAIRKESKRRTESRRTSAKKESYKYMINEKTLNPFLTKFIKENYKNAQSMRAVGAKISGKTLKIECEIKFKSGSVKKTTIALEGFVPSVKKRTFNAKADSAFKVESKRAPFKFEAFTKGNIINFSGMSYIFLTQKEGKKLQISGKYSLKESAKRR